MLTRTVQTLREKAQKSQQRPAYADGLLIASVNASTTSYYHEDALGSVRLVSSSTATPVFSANYRGYGSIYAPSGKSTFQYTDKPTDTATGLYYSGARFYDPASGRFMTEDTSMGTLSVPLSLNRYVYALDNPMRYVDPTGHYDVQNNGGGGSAGVSIITENVMVSTTTEETITTYCYEDVCTASTYYALVGAPVTDSVTTSTTTASSSNPEKTGSGPSENQYAAFATNVIIISLFAGGGPYGLLAGSPGFIGMLYYDYQAGSNSTPQGVLANFAYYEDPVDWLHILGGTFEAPPGFGIPFFNW